MKKPYKMVYTATKNLNERSTSPTQYNNYSPLGSMERPTPAVVNLNPFAIKDEDLWKVYQYFRNANSHTISDQVLELLSHDYEENAKVARREFKVTDKVLNEKSGKLFFETASVEFVCISLLHKLKAQMSKTKVIETYFKNLLFSAIIQSSM